MSFITRETTREEFFELRVKFNVGLDEIKKGAKISNSTFHKANRGEFKSMSPFVIFRLNRYFAGLAEKEGM